MEVQGIYGNTSKTECTIYVYDDWYAIEGSVNCNRCIDDSLLIVDGIDVETIKDIDMWVINFKNVSTITLCEIILAFL